MHSETLDDAVFYSSSTYLRVMIAIRITLACIALILLSILHINRKRFIAHRNLTLLLDIHSFWVFITCTSIVADHAYMIYLLPQAPNYLIHSDFTCILRFAPQCIGIYGSISSLFMMCLERFAASNSMESYEESHKNIGYKLAALHILIVVFLSTILFNTYGHESGETAYCNVTSPKGQMYYPFLGAVVFGMEASTIVVLIRLLRKNENRLKHVTIPTLTERYQISENVRMIRIILPVVTSHVALSTFAIVIFFSVIYFMKLPNVYFPLFEDSINLMFLQGIFMPFFFLRQFRMNSKWARQVMDINTSSGEELTATHTAAIHATWYSTNTTMSTFKC